MRFRVIAPDFMATACMWREPLFDMSDALWRLKYEMAVSWNFKAYVT